MKRCNVFVYIINKPSLRSWLCIIRIVLSSLPFSYCSLRDHIMCKAHYKRYIYIFIINGNRTRSASFPVLVTVTAAA